MVIKLECIERTNADLMQNMENLKENLDYTQMVEFNLKNKLINNISTSNVRYLMSLNLKRLAINICKIQSIEKGIFNSMLQLNSLSLAYNQIYSIEIDSFVTEPYENHIYQLLLSSNNLKKITREIFNGLSKLQILYLDNNYIEDINVDSFENMPKLKQLHLHSNYIKLVENEMFLDKAELEILYLYQNNIETIETIPFNTLYSLKKLHLFSNKITQIKIGNFIHLVKLEELKLDKNEIGTFEINTFTGLENLKVLDMSANKIEELENRVFHSLKSLKKLDLHLNDINQIEPNAFIDLPNLSYLNLDSNKIVSLEDIQFNQNLSELSIQYNMLSNLDEINSKELKSLKIANNLIQTIRSINSLANLEYLDLSQNRLIKIEANSFKSLKKLKYLNLSGNKLDLESVFNNASYFKSQMLLEILDFSFNEIKYLDSNVTFQQLTSLKALNLSNNRLKFIEEYLFGYLRQLTELNLASNNLSLSMKNYFYNLGYLKTLKLGFNQINSTYFLQSNSDIRNLEYLHLEHNKIDLIEEKDFENFAKLKFLNLNSNPIKIIQDKAFEKMNSLQSLKLSNTSIKHLTLSSSLKELDLSYLNFSIFSKKDLSTLEWISLANARTNISIENFISNSTKFIDFSFNLFDFKILNVLGSSLKTLILRQTNLQDLEHIYMKILINLKYLDLAFNNLTFISPQAFGNTKLLEYLDLSSNSIYDFEIDLKLLKYLNLDNNKIEKTNEVLLDLFSIETFKMANNRLKKYPYFEKTQSDSNNFDTFLEIHLNDNQLDKIEYFTFIFGKLNLANFESNNISFIDSDAFLNCRSLEFLSLANNRLVYISENNFHFLFSLVYLNLSFNRIEIIEKNSFKNLNKLKSLDLNYNKLHSIENNLLFGLTNLNFLSLLSQNKLKILNQSFSYLPRISTIVLNESLVIENECILVRIQDKKVQRAISNKYVFYKSINLLTVNFSFNDNFAQKCDLVFRFFQFNVHLNLKTDEMFYIFYETCKTSLIYRENNYNFTQGRIKKCVFNHSYIQTNFNDEQILIKTTSTFRKILSNFYFISTMSLLIIFLGPVFYLILRHVVYFDRLNDSANNIQGMLNELEIKIKKRRQEVVQILDKDLKLEKYFRNEKSKLCNSIQMKKNDIKEMKEKFETLKNRVQSAKKGLYEINDIEIPQENPRDINEFYIEIDNLITKREEMKKISYLIDSVNINEEDYNELTREKSGKNNDDLIN
jgi:Leucine-rich repeat (LRR) protein